MSTPDAVSAPVAPGDPAAAPEYQTPSTGLDAQQVADRVARGAVNDTGERTSRTITEIVRANVFTRFNAILGTMLAVIIVVGPIQDGLFGFVLVANSLIGIVQEVRAKRTLDRLAVLNAPVARVVRDGAVADVAVEAVVLDDLLELRTGDQIPCDGVVQGADGLEVDESLLTGESDPVDKKTGDMVLSGSFVVAGSGRFQATRIGADAYARRIAAEARKFQLARSELMDGINLILRIITWILIPVSALLFWRQIEDHELEEALRGTVAGVVGMVPEGLVLLTSIAFGVGRGHVGATEGAGTGAAGSRRPRARRRGVPRQDRHPHRGRDRVRRAGGARRAATEPGSRTRSARSRTTRTPTRRSPRSHPRSRRPRAGPAPARCRSPRHASGARPRSTATGPG